MFELKVPLPLVVQLIVPPDPPVNLAVHEVEEPIVITEGVQVTATWAASVNVVVAVFVPSVAVTVNVPTTSPSVAYVVVKPPEVSALTNHALTVPSGLVTLTVIFPFARNPVP